MPLRYVAEMFCDRVAASRIYNGAAYRQSDPLRYYLKGRTRRRMHPDTARFLEKLLRMLAVKGEDYTFAWLRWYMQTHKDY